MRGLVVVVLLAAGVFFGMTPSPTEAASTCLGKPVTHVMKPGDPKYGGTAGDDVVLGSNGNDRIDLYDVVGGVDFVCGGAGNDRIDIAGPGSIAEGGTGNDTMIAFNGATARGDAGNDTVSAQNGARAEGGSGNDTLDIVVGSIGDGGSGDDVITGGSGGSADVTMLGGSGSDRIESDQGHSTIDCGSGKDTVSPGESTNVRGCEKVLP